METSVIKEYAEKLDAAEQECCQIDALSMTHPDIKLADAYRIQKNWVDIKIARGQQIIGKKIGLTSRAMQMAMNISEPDFGTLLDTMRFENGSTLKAENFLDPRIEVELAFVLATDLSGKNLSVSDVLEATAYIVPALEIIAARSYRVHPETGYVRNVFDTISDNAANAGIILGDEKIKPNQCDLSWVSAVLYYNGQVEETGVAAGVLGHPANGLVWLAKRLADFGDCLKEGEIVLAGSFTRPVICRNGDVFKADYGPFGEISANFN